ncbi:MAG: ATP-binding protein [Candidatus Rokuibacteriota bacterium]
MGLRLRLVLVLMVPVVLVIGVYGYLRIRHEQTQLLAEQQGDVALTAKAVQIAVENALRDRQIADIERLLVEMVEHQEAIDRIRLFDRGFAPVLVSNPLSIGEDVPLEALRQAVATGTPQAIYQSRRGRPVLYYVMPIRDRHGQTAGAMELVHLATRVHERVRAANRDVVLRLTLLVASIAALAGVMLQRQVLRPLARLVDGIRRLGRGEPGPPLPVERRDELGRVAEAFNEMAEHLEAARRQLLTETERALDLERQLRQAAMLAVAGKLASGIAHEVGTPLNIISGRAEFLLKTALPESPERRDLEIIVRQIERISKIIQGLLDSVRAQKPEIQPVAVHEFVQEFLPLLRHAARRRGVTLTAAMPEAVPAMLADPAQLQQVVLNLVLNALEATPAGGRVAISARQHDRNGQPGVAVAVSDTGAGIPAEQLPRIFDPFFTTKPRGKGTGLGLAICRDIVRAHGGDIEVASQAGAGATFTFWMPAARPERP